MIEKRFILWYAADAGVDLDITECKVYQDLLESLRNSW